MDIHHCMRAYKFKSLDPDMEELSATISPVAKPESSAKVLQIKSKNFLLL